MKTGKAPFAPKVASVGKQSKYVIHHKQPIAKGGGVYDLDNLIIASPKMHQNIIDTKYHFGTKG
ncbi:HNH endonuclease [Clostridium estertheticum]|uniref:HNH endonuclease n=1 Tax=Clostridium estertheticum TaxID=238834 RepID=UPI001C7DE138|nr:HNH endonuclease [Clostridium estertheticum]MBX4262272.1 HNH endonuclease [Clostridium estertheticum]WLC71996.1 HNH endonuclease [Clostridium estertheticum]